MKFSSQYIKYSASVALAMGALGSNPANAALKNVPLSINLVTEEQLAPPIQPDRIACPNNSAFAGITKGTGDISIGSGKRIYKGPVLALATDCATAEMQFSNGRLTVIANVNGNTLTATYNGSFIPVGPGTAPGTVIYKVNNGAFAITGGTGYFVGATGTGSLDGTVIVPSNILQQPDQIIKGALKAIGRISFSTAAFEQTYGIGE